MSPESNVDVGGKEGFPAVESFYEPIPEALIISGSEGNIVYTNKAAHVLLEYEREELVGMPLSDLLVDQEIGEVLFRELFEKGRVSNYELSLRKRDGTIIYALASGTVSLDEEGEIQQTYGMFQDVTELRSERALVITAIRDITERKIYEDKLEALHTHASKLASAECIEEIAGITLDAFESVFGYHGIDFLEVEDGVLRLIESRGRERTPSSKEVPFDGEELLAESARTGSSILVSDVRERQGSFETREETLSALIVPVKGGKDVKAVLNLESKRSEAFTERNQRLVETLAEHVSSAITRLRQVEEIQASEARYRQLLEELPDPVFVTDGERCILVNQELVELLGYGSPIELIEQPLVEFFPPGFRGFVERRVLRDDDLDLSSSKYDISMLSKDGEEIEVEINVRSIEFGGEITVLGVIRDISERLRYEERMQLLYRHASRLSLADDREEVAENTIYLLKDVFGFSRASFSVVEDGVLKVVEADPYTTIWEISLDTPSIVVRGVNTGETQVVFDVREDEDYIDAVPEGETPTLSELVVPVKSGGEVVAAINIESDRVGAFSEEDAELVETLAMHVSSALTRLEYEWRLQALESYSNQLHRASNVKEVNMITVDFVSEVLGFSRTGIGLVDGDVVYPLRLAEPIAAKDISVDASSIIARAVRTGESQLVSDTREDPDYLSYSEEGGDSLSELAVPIKDGSRVIGVINVESKKLDAYDERDKRIVELFSDHVSSSLSRLRRVEELEELVEERTGELREAYEELKELDRMKDQFMGMATHELRTPLVSIKGYVDYIMDGSVGEVPEQIGEMLEVVQRNTERLSKITDDLLDQQRIESGKLEIQPESIELESIIRDVMEEVEPMMESKKQELKVDYPGKLSPLNIDGTRISQVLVNLLSNASKFSPNNSEIDLVVEERANCIEVSISDEGIGLSEEDMEKLFQPFPQIERPTVTEKSTGLGLSICKGIVELHGGEIWAESEGRGEGSTFTFTIPKQMGESR